MRKVMALLITLALMISMISCGEEKLIWNEIILCDMLPEPPAKEGEIHTNSADDLWVSINDISDKEFNDYIEACKEKGFNIDPDSGSSSYSAYNDKGYKLKLGHYGSDADLSITLEAPMEMTTISWPTSSAGNQLPVPKSTVGKFSYEYEDNFFVYIGNTSRADYTEYISICSEKGFTVDYSKGDNYYYANNSDGWYVDIRYVGNNIMSISISAPKNDESNTVTQPETSAQTSNSNTSETEADVHFGLDSDFKTAMDDYEKFMNEYVAFMKKFKDNPGDPGLLVDYADYISKYADFVKDFEKWEGKEMNAAETAYYIDVQARVNKKLLEVAN